MWAVKLCLHMRRVPHLLGFESTPLPEQATIQPTKLASSSLEEEDDDKWGIFFPISLPLDNCFVKRLLKPLI